MNAVHFNDVRVPASQLVGEEGKGWTYATSLLGRERIGLAKVERSKERLALAKQRASEIPGRRPNCSLLQDDVFSDRVAWLEAELAILEITQLRAIVGEEKVNGNDPFPPVLKIKGTELIQATTDLLAEVAGIRSMTIGGKGASMGWQKAAGASSIIARAASIYGGANEVQKNIIAKKILAL